MVKFSQTSWFNGQKADALRLLRYGPATLSITEKPVISYFTPGGTVAGAEVHYALVSGFRKTTWKGIISSVSDKSFIVRLAQGETIFRGFDAEHSLLQGVDRFSCSDSLVFQGESPEFKAAADIARMAYAFPARAITEKTTLAVEAERKTGEFRAFGAGTGAG